MASFTLTAVKPEPKIWKSEKFGEFAIYDVSYHSADGDKDAQIKQKVSTKPPAPGDALDAELVAKDGFPPELKRLPPAKTSGGSSGGDFRTPAQIMRSDAHGKAMHWMDIKVAAGEWQKISWEQYIAMVDAYYQDIKAAS